MTLSYRTRRRLVRLGTTVLILAAVALVVWLCWMVWVGRYMVYHRDLGPQLDFGLSATFPSGMVAEPPAQQATVQVIYNEPEIEAPVVEETTPTSISGYYITAEELKTDITAVRTAVEELPDGAAILLDVKDTKGRFYYTTSVGATNAKDVDTAQMDDLIQYLLSRDLHVIARLPAFRDYEFGLNNVPCGLPRKGGNGSLWLDDTNCYWLDPTSEGTLEYLEQQAMELRLMGFDEVVFTDFRFPDTEKITFEGDKAQAIADAAATLVSALSTDHFYVSFTSTDPAFPLPEGSCRLYLTDIAAADISTVVERAVTQNPALQLMFLTTVNDTRFNDYCVLRPLDSLS